MGGDFKTVLGTRLREARLAARLTQEDAAAELVRSRQTISSWEAGRTAPTVEELCDLVMLYGASPDRVLCGDAAAATQDLVNSARRPDKTASAA